jgi:hypothetical protein
LSRLRLVLGRNRGNEPLQALPLGADQPDLAETVERLSERGNQRQRVTRGGPSGGWRGGPMANPEDCLGCLSDSLSPWLGDPSQELLKGRHSLVDGGETAA